MEDYRVKSIIRVMLSLRPCCWCFEADRPHCFVRLGLGWGYGLGLGLGRVLGLGLGLASLSLSWGWMISTVASLLFPKETVDCPSSTSSGKELLYVSRGGQRMVTNLRGNVGGMVYSICRRCCTCTCKNNNTEHPQDKTRWDKTVVSNLPRICSQGRRN